MEAHSGHENAIVRVRELKGTHTKQLAKKKEPKKKYWSYRWANALDWMPPPRRRATAGGHG